MQPTPPAGHRNLLDEQFELKYNIDGFSRRIIVNKISFLLLPIVIGLTCVSLLHAQDLSVSLTMPSHSFAPGSACGLDLDITNNAGAYNNVRVFVVLELGFGSYWFYPGWGQLPFGLDYKTMNIPASDTVHLTILAPFTWPSGAGEFSNANFLSAVFTGDYALLSNLATFTFGWQDGPQISSVEPQNAAPGQSFSVHGSGFGTDPGDVYLEINSIPVPALSLKNHPDGTATVMSMIPIMESGTYAMTLHTDSHTSNSVNFTVNALPETGKPTGAVMTELNAGMQTFGTILKSDIIDEAINHGDIPAGARDDYYAEIDQAMEIFEAFAQEFNTLSPLEQDTFERIMVQNSLHTLFEELNIQAAAVAAASPQTDLNFYISLDSTSACITALDIAWTAVDVAAAIAVLVSGPIGVAMPACAGGLHLAIKILDKALDGFVVTDLKSFSMDDGSAGDNHILARVGVDATAVLLGRYETQDPWQKAGFNAVLDVMFFGFFEKLPFTEEAKSQAIKSILGLVGNVLQNLGLNLATDILSLDQPPDGNTIQVDFEYMKTLSINQALSFSSFGGNPALITAFWAYIYMYDVVPGVINSDPTVATISFNQETVIIKPLKEGTTNITLRGIHFAPFNAAYVVSPEIFKTVDTQFRVDVEENIKFYAQGMIGCQNMDPALFFNGINLHMVSNEDFIFTGSGQGTDYDGDSIYFLLDGKFFVSQSMVRVTIGMYSDPEYEYHIRTDRADAYPYQGWFYDDACELIEDTSADCRPIWFGIKFTATQQSPNTNTPWIILTDNSCRNLAQ